MKKAKNKGTRDILRRVTGVFSTVGQIAEKLGVKDYHIEYLIRSRDLEATCRVGNYRLFSPAQVRQMKILLEEIQSGELKRSRR